MSGLTTLVLIEFSTGVYLYVLQAYDEARRRLQKETEDRQVIVPELRKQSRHDYLRKRQAEKLEDLEMEIGEEEYYFGGVCVSVCLVTVSAV